MNKEELDGLWAQVMHVGKIEHLSWDAMVALGSVFGKMSKVIEDQQIEVEKAYDNWALGNYTDNDMFEEVRRIIDKNRAEKGTKKF